MTYRLWGMGWAIIREGVRKLQGANSDCALDFDGSCANRVLRLIAGDETVARAAFVDSRRLVS